MCTALPRRDRGPDLSEPAPLRTVLSAVSARLPLVRGVRGFFRKVNSASVSARSSSSSTPRCSRATRSAVTRSVISSAGAATACRAARRRSRTRRGRAHLVQRPPHAVRLAEPGLGRVHGFLYADGEQGRDSGFEYLGLMMRAGISEARGISQGVGWGEAPAWKARSVLARADHDRTDRQASDETGEAGAGWLPAERIARHDRPTRDKGKTLWGEAQPGRHDQSWHEQITIEMIARPHDKPARPARLFASGMDAGRDRATHQKNKSTIQCSTYPN